jgi:hypothetical protein
MARWKICLMEHPFAGAIIYEHFAVANKTFSFIKN